MTAPLRSILTRLREFGRGILIPDDANDRAVYEGEMIGDLELIADDMEHAIREIESRRELPEGRT